MGGFFAELKRRHIYRVGAAYVVAAWVLIQVVDVLSQVFALPSWIAQPAIVLLVIGFPIALVAAWMIESKPHEAVASAVRSKTTTVDWMLFGAVTLLIAVTGYQQLVRPPNVATPPSPTTAISVAVLPFSNLSGDASQEFFSDGMTEEITSALARVQGLTVLARTSAFEFKGQNRNIREIGQALNARYLIEGSVRREGDRVRITAQLVQADNGANVWTESYDRQLTSVFATQEDIARAIAGALRVPLGLGQGQQLVSNRTNNPESYDQYLRAKALVRARGLTPLTEAVSLLEQVVERDPNYAPAWALLSRAYGFQVSYGPALRTGSLEAAARIREAAAEKEERAAREAIRLDPKHPLGYAALGVVQIGRGNRVEGEDLYRQALALDPNDTDVLYTYIGSLTGAAGRLREAVRLSERLRMLEPFVPIYNVMASDALRMNGQARAAIAILEALPPDAAGGYLRNVTLAQAYAAEGRFAEAADTLLLIRSEAQLSRRSVEEAAGLLRSAPTRVVDPSSLPVLEGELNFVYLYVGAPDRVFEYLERQLAINRYTSTLGDLWFPEFASLRKTERYKALVRTPGIDSYWRARGWPDLCRPVGADDFVCD
jgi:TolB-like protein